MKQIWTRNRSNPSGSITSHKWFTSLKAKVELRTHVFLERALSLRSSSINSFLGGPRRVFCQLDIFAYPRRVILHKVFVDVRRQRPGGSTFGCATGKIIAYKVFKKYRREVSQFPVCLERFHP